MQEGNFSVEGSGLGRKRSERRGKLAFRKEIRGQIHDQAICPTSASRLSRPPQPYRGKQSNIIALGVSHFSRDGSDLFVFQRELKGFCTFLAFFLARGAYFEIMGLGVRKETKRRAEGSVGDEGEGQCEGEGASLGYETHIVFLINK
jgi:hypothetical protein